MAGIAFADRFQSLNNFKKPAACEFNVTAERRFAAGNATLGWRPGESKIYYEDGCSAGHYNLPNPLDKMTQAELAERFRVDTSYVAKNEGFLGLWIEATQKRLQLELESVTPATANISPDLIAVTKGAPGQILHFGDNYIKMNTLGGTNDSALMVRMMGEKGKSKTADILSRPNWSESSPIVEVQLGSGGKYLYFHPTRGGRLMQD